MGRMKDLSIPANGPDVTHDPLCTMATDTDARDFDWCMCPLIAKVRADERDCDNHGEAIRYRCAHYKAGRQDMLANCIAAIEAVPEDMDSSAEWDCDYDVDETGETRNPRIWLREATAALRALSGNESAPDFATNGERA